MRKPSLDWDRFVDGLDTIGKGIIEGAGGLREGPDKYTVMLAAIDAYRKIESEMNIIEVRKSEKYKGLTLLG